MIDGLIKMAVHSKEGKAKQEQRVKPTHAPVARLTAEERQQGPITQKALHNNLMAILRLLNVPAVARGSIVGYILQEAMAARKTMPSASRKVMDYVFTIDIGDVSRANLFDKFILLVNGLKKAELNSFADMIGVAVPVVNLVKYFQVHHYDKMDLSVLAGIVRDCVEIIPLPAKSIKPVLLNVASMMEANNATHLTADEVLLKVNGSFTPTDFGQYSTLGDSIYTIRDLLVDRSEERIASNIAQLFRDMNLKPLGDFIADIPTLQKANTSVPQIADRLARLVDETQYVNKDMLNISYTAVDRLIDSAVPTYREEALNTVTDLVSSTQTDVMNKMEKASASLEQFANNSRKVVDKAVFTFQGAFKAIMRNADILLGNFSSSSKLALASLIETVETTYDEVRALVEMIVFRATDIGRFFLCHMKGATAMNAKCTQLLEEHRSILSLFHLPMPPMTSVEKAAVKMQSTLQTFLVGMEAALEEVIPEIKQFDVGKELLSPAQRSTTKRWRSLDDEEESVSLNDEEENVEVGEELGTKLFELTSTLEKLG